MCSTNDKLALIDNRSKLDYIPNKYGIGYEYFYCMKRNADKIAQYLEDTNESETYGELLQKSVRTALKLASLGIKRDDVICLSTFNHKNACVPYIASQFLKARISALDPQLSLNETVHLLKLTKPKIIFLSTNAIDLTVNALNQANLQALMVVFGETNEFIQFSEFLEPNEKESQFQPVTEGSIQDIAAVFFSSGTTGFPKGVCLSHQTLLTESVASLRYFQLYNDCALSNYFIKKIEDEEKQDVFLVYSPYYWVTATFILNKAIFVGASRVVCNKFDSIKFWSIVGKYKITATVQSVRMAADILNAEPVEKGDMASLKAVHVGGSSISQTLIKNLARALPDASVFQIYGCTEMAGCVSAFVPNDDGKKLQIQKPLSCGKINIGVCCKIVDPETEEVLDIKHTGEIRLKSKYVMSGYLNMDSSDSFDDDGFLKTGDLGYIDEDQCLYVIDRIKEILKYKGWHVSPAFIENVLNGHLGVKESVVFGIPHDIDGEHPMALVVLHDNVDISSDDIKKYVDERVVERDQLRAGVKIVDAIPKSVTSKIKRKFIRDMVLNNQL